ncbi:hypothetical protein CPHO_07065 [Corynebacterium phocae]|uniref:Tail assembly chaperone n=1 Tax=Corynebacterium phocae TaxID=161895 RepID=A0A1L7D3P3_9CORY|nr:hypothetical protein [Corynebacterium phocae]APT92693.1 hypothetical protein CPHO_07065 [Corynebacterium phocae]KAA8723582.1 hypothetical protein F4V58_06570 [Corynebacterium phocae]
MTKKIRDLGSFEDLIAQRRDALGADGKTVTFPGFGKDWEVAAPGLQSAEWNDDFSALNQDYKDELLSFADFRAEFCSMILGEQAEDFSAACDKAGVDPVTLLNWALESIQKDVAENPTRRTSATTRQRARRR